MNTEKTLTEEVISKELKKQIAEEAVKRHKLDKLIKKQRKYDILSTECLIEIDYLKKITKDIEKEKKERKKNRHIIYKCALCYEDDFDIILDTIKIKHKIYLKKKDKYLKKMIKLGKKLELLNNQNEAVNETKENKKAL